MLKFIHYFTLFFLPFTNCIGAEDFYYQDKEPFLYLSLETKNRTTIQREPSGAIRFNINPRENEIVEIGGHIIKSPKNFIGSKITIGTFQISKFMTDQQFLNTISQWDKIISECVLEPIEE